MAQLSGKMHLVMGTLHGGIVMKTFGNCDSLATCLGREHCQNCLCLLVLFIEISRHFIPIFDRNNLTYPKKCALTSITALNAELILVPSAISFNLAMSHTPESRKVSEFSKPSKLSSNTNKTTNKVLTIELGGYNHSLVSFLVDGVTFSFKLGGIGERSLSIQRNHTSVSDYNPSVQA